LNCWDTSKRGERVWQRNLYDDYQMPRRAKVGRSARRDYGYTTAPLVHGDWLLVEVGGPTGTIVAFDKQTGHEQWRSEATSVAGHTGGLTPMTVEGIPCLAVMTFDGLLVIRLDSGHKGKTVATYPWITDFANNIASPAVQDDCVLMTSEYNHKSICKLRITINGAEKLWEQPYSSKTCTPVIHGGRVYMAWNRVRALDWQTGELLWEGPSVGDAGSCVVTTDEKLILWVNRGDLILADIAAAEQPRFVELARVGRLAKTDAWPHVVVSNGQILCRDRQGQLTCLSSATSP
jgi:outer membrane protein assembly factor BamB